MPTPIPGRYVYARLVNRWIPATYHDHIQPKSDLRDLALHAFREVIPVRIVVETLRDIYPRYRVLTVTTERMTLVDIETEESCKVRFDQVTHLRLADEEKERRHGK